MCLIVFDVKVFHSFFFSKVFLTIHLSKKKPKLSMTVFYYGDIKFIYE